MILESVENGPLIWPTVEENESCQGFMRESSITDASLPPEWSKFVTDVKLVKDLHTTNFDQLHAYLEQRELHVKEVRLLREHNQDPLAFVANRQMTPPHFNTYQSSYNNPQTQQYLPPEWSKFVTDVKLVKDLHTTNFDQIHAYLEQRELHVKEVRLLREHNQDPIAFVTDIIKREKSKQNQTKPSTKQKAWKSQKSTKVIKVNPIKVKDGARVKELLNGPTQTHLMATVGQTQNVYAARAYQGGNSYQPQGNGNLHSYRLDNYLGPPGFNQNQNFQNRNQGNSHGIPHGNNQGRNQFFQGASHGQNPPPAYQAPTYQASGYQAPENDAILKNMETNMTSLTNSNLELKNMFGQFMKMNTTSSLGSGTLPSNTVTNPKEDLKGITTRSETAYQGPMIPTTFSSLPKVVECKTKVTKYTVPPTNNRSTKDVQPLVVQIETPMSNSKPVVSPVAEPVSALKPNEKPSIPYPSRIHDQKLRDKANDQKEKIFKIFKDLNFNINFADALILMPKFGPTIKTLADLDASMNLMPLFVWNKLSLPKLTPTLMTLELAYQSISRPIGAVEDVFVKVGKFHFPVDFIVVDFDVDPRVPLILGRSFLKTGRALIEIYAGELTLRVNNEAVTFNLDQTLRYSTNYNDMTANRIDVIDMVCEEYSQEVLSFFDVIASGNPTRYYDPIVSTSSLTLTPFGDSDFLLEEVDAFLALEDDPTSLKLITL
nr:hypothetical protein [Tanacetum cinerariifolium]